MAQYTQEEKKFLDLLRNGSNQFKARVSELLGNVTGKSSF